MATKRFLKGAVLSRRTAALGFKKESIPLLSESVKRAVLYLKDNYREDFDLNALSSIAGLSRFHFCRVFKNETGMTCFKLRSMLRIEEAKQLLSNTRSSVSEICYGVGFNDLTNFERIFKKETGYTPKGYRKIKFAALSRIKRLG